MMCSVCFLLLWKYYPLIGTIFVVLKFSFIGKVIKKVIDYLDDEDLHAIVYDVF